MCGGYNIPCLVLHDFDKSGFSIFATLGRSGHRYAYRNHVEFIDLGFRLADIDGLETEAVFDSGDEYQRRRNLRENGATPEEIDFLLKERVELNAMASDDVWSNSSSASFKKTAFASFQIKTSSIKPTACLIVAVR